MTNDTGKASQMTNDTGEAGTHILFEDGQTVEVSISLYSAPKGSSRPIDAYVVTECEGDFTRASRRAAESVYNKLQENQKLEPQVVGFDLHGLEAGQTITGESCGLAFAVALAKKLYNGANPGPVAATGEIQSSLGGGVISPIKGIKTKLETAAQLIPENGWVFYPKENEAEVPEDLKKKFKQRNIKIHAVTTVNETLDILFGESGRLDRKSENKHKKYIYIISAFLVLAAGLLLFSNIPREPEEVHQKKPAKEAIRIVPPEKQETKTEKGNNHKADNRGFE